MTCATLVENVMARPVSGQSHLITLHSTRSEFSTLLNPDCFILVLHPSGLFPRNDGDYFIRERHGEARLGPKQSRHAPPTRSAFSTLLNSDCFVLVLHPSGLVPRNDVCYVSRERHGEARLGPKPSHRAPPTRSEFSTSCEAGLLRPRPSSFRTRSSQ